MQMKKLSIGKKLALGFTLALGMALLVIYLLMQWSFDRGLLSYINTLDEQKVERVALELESRLTNPEYWQKLIQRPRIWHELLRSSTRMYMGLDRFDAPRRPPRQPRRDIFGDPDVLDGSDTQVKPHRPPNPRGPANPPFLLLDAGKTAIYGRRPPTDELRLREIKANDMLLGYLGWIPRKRIVENHNLSFSGQQWEVFGLACIIVFLISFPFAWLLRSNIVRPIRQLSAGLRSLVSGDFSMRIESKRGDELGQLCNDLNILAHTLAQNKQSQQQWVADISHELRTPIGVLKGEVEAMQDGIRPLTMEQLASVQKEVGRLQRLVEDLYQLALHDAGALKYRFSTVLVSDVINHVLRLNQKQLDQHQLTVSVQVLGEESCVLADEQRLEQVFINLITNSIRYTDRPGRLKIQLKAKEQLEISWQDSAPGVQPENIPKLFQRLYREDGSRNRASGGAGLGLAICQQVIKGHQGKLLAKPGDFGGLNLIVTLPWENK